MIKLFKGLAFFMFVAVGYHYFNHSIGITIAQSIAIILLALCFLALYEPYVPDTKNYVGWFLIIISCLIISFSNELDWWLVIPLSLLYLGYKLAELYTNTSMNGGNGGVGSDCSGDFDSGDSGGGGE